MRLLKDLNRVPYWETMLMLSVARVLLHFRNGWKSISLFPFCRSRHQILCYQVRVEGRTLTQDWTLRKSPHEVARAESVETCVRVIRCSAPVLRGRKSGPCRAFHQRQRFSHLARGRHRDRWNPNFWPSR